VAGYYEEYDGLTFLTVKGAGHMVPQDRPVHALDMLSTFINGTVKKYDKVTPKTYGPLCAK
jgi:carboxypeptidase C (cathepsin A)